MISTYSLYLHIKLKCITYLDNLHPSVRKKGLKLDLYSRETQRKTAAAADRYIERFNRLYREAVLYAYLFFDLDLVRQLTAEWIEEYRQRRPHEVLGNLTPFEWKESLVKHRKLYFQLSEYLGGAHHLTKLWLNTV